MTYGCYNRQPIVEQMLVQVGWCHTPGLYNNEEKRQLKTRVPDMIMIPQANSKDCQYSKKTYDKGCIGCKHNNFPSKTTR